jgi:hypothetical protein
LSGGANKSAALAMRWYIEDEVMEHCVNEMHRGQQEMLARRATT